VSSSGLEHERIESDGVVERYVLGTLSTEERDAFEEHLVGCADCAARVDWTSDLRAALAAEAAGRSISSGPSAESRRSSRQPVWLPIAACIGLVTLIGLANRTWQLGRAVETAESDAARWRTLYDEGRRGAAGERAPRAQSTQLPAAADPIVNVPNLMLVSVRGEAPAQRLAVTPDAAWLLLSLELEVEPEATYSARITTATGTPVWAGTGLRPVGPSLLSMLLPTRLLGEGDYVVVVENANAPVGAPPYGRYSFRLARPPSR